MPTNLYGPGDNFDLEASHEIPALIRKLHEAKVAGAKEVVVWGSGAPRREFLYSDDMAEACLFLMRLDDERFGALLRSDESRTGRLAPPLVNIGLGEDVTIRELAELIHEVVGFGGEIVWDRKKPDGTPRKLMDISRMQRAGWRAGTGMRAGLAQTIEVLRSSK